MVKLDTGSKLASFFRERMGVYKIFDMNCLQEDKGNVL